MNDAIAKSLAEQFGAYLAKQNGIGFDFIMNRTPSKNSHVVLLRRAVMYQLKQKGATYNAIARVFAMDHSTVMSALKGMSTDDRDFCSRLICGWLSSDEGPKDNSMVYAPLSQCTVEMLTARKLAVKDVDALVRFILSTSQVYHGGK